ncbi:MAG TPA: NADPH-dependent FMN reductase, partial [Xanthomarina gelatinilytica]|nr:NADPH-dependent FMN reductase [Xanthomarina gelatinilytica]
HQAQIIADFSLPFFETNFSDGKITNKELDDALKNKINLFKNAI